jgi:hypothetical protein
MRTALNQAKSPQLILQKYNTERGCLQSTALEGLNP